MTIKIPEASITQNITEKQLQNRVDNVEEKMKANPSSTTQFYRINWGENSDEEWLPERGRRGAEQMCTTEQRRAVLWKEIVEREQMRWGFDWYFGYKE